MLKAATLLFFVSGIFLCSALWIAADIAAG